MIFHLISQIGEAFSRKPFSPRPQPGTVLYILYRDQTRSMYSTIENKSSDSIRIHIGESPYFVEEPERSGHPTSRATI
jgi:hypothetical protein